MYGSRRLNEIVISVLYDSVFFWGSVDFPYPGWQKNLPPPNWTEVWNLEAFTRSYRDSVSLRAHVRNVDIRWHNTYKNDDEDVLQCLAALKSSCLRTLHLSPATFSFVIPASIAVTSLSFQHDGLSGSYYPEDYA